MPNDYDPTFDAFQDELNHAVYGAINSVLYKYVGYFEMRPERLEALLVSSVDTALENWVLRYIESENYLELLGE